MDTVAQMRDQPTDGRVADYFPANSAHDGREGWIGVNDNTARIRSEPPRSRRLSA